MKRPASFGPVSALLLHVRAQHGDVPKDFSGLKDIFAQKDFADLNPIVEDEGASLYVGVPVPSLAVGKALLDAYRPRTRRLCQPLLP